jgi:NAD(P)-dependent dehydrogenase (short-subunit alcohol dehydrogenase family)
MLALGLAPDLDRPAEPLGQRLGLEGPHHVRRALPHRLEEPRRRVGKPEDLDALVLLLASDASGFVNGAVIAADDGLSVS